MDEPNTDVIQGTLDMLILKTLSLEPMHGFGIARRIEQVSRGVFKVNPGSLLTAFQRLERAGGWIPSGGRPRIRAAPKSTRSPRPGRKQLERRLRTGPPGIGDRAAVEGGGIGHVALAPVHPRPAVLVNRRAADQEIADEVVTISKRPRLRSWRRGLSPEEARRAARLELGSATAVREQVRAYGWENAIGVYSSDLRYAARRLRGNPGFAAVSVLTLALGIGASTAIFSVIEGVLLKPLPYPQSEQLVALMHTAPGIKIKELNMAPSLYFTYSEENRVFQDVGMWTGDAWTRDGPGRAGKSPGTVGDSNRFLAVLGVQPALGRAFTAADEDPNSERTVMLSDGYWRSRFGGDRSVLGRRILLDGNAYEVIGVLPPSFQFMDRKISLLVPLRFNRANVA